MLIKKANQQTQFIEGEGQANPNLKILLLRLVHDCVQEKPAYYTRLCYRETHVRRPLYATMCKSNPRTGIKFSNKFFLKVFKHHSKHEPRQDTTHWINPNGTSPSECQHSLFWYTKGHLRIEVCQNTIDGHDMRCIYHSTSLPYYFSKCWMAYATIFIATRIRTRLFPLTTRVLYATISIATHIYQYTRVSFK